MEAAYSCGAIEFAFGAIGAHGMLVQVDPRTLGLNLALIIGAVVLLALGFALTIAIWTGARVLIAIIQQRRAKEQYLRETFRSDGRPYPPYTEGVCQECGRGDSKIYHPDSGERLCPVCYERFWRRVAGV